MTEVLPQDLPWFEHMELNVHQKLLLVRADIGDEKLSKWFTLQRDFEAFGIHELVSKLQPYFTKYGILPAFQVDSWSKGGRDDKFAIVKGFTEFVNVDKPEDKYIVWGVGEGMDGSDKGFGKAVSYARKNIFIQALNLSTGVDNENFNDQGEMASGGQARTQHEPVHAGGDPTHGQTKPYVYQGPAPQENGAAYAGQAAQTDGRGGAPQPGPVQQGDQPVQPDPPGATGNSQNPVGPHFALSWYPGENSQMVDASEVLLRITEWITKLKPGDASSIEVFTANNQASLNEFWEHDHRGPNNGRVAFAVKSIIETARSKALEATG